MSFWKHAKLLGPLLSVVVVGACIGSSLTGYELPKYEIEAQAAQVEEEEPAASDDDIMSVGNWDLDDGVYRGTGVGYGGEVVVDVTIADKTITQIDIVSESDDAAFFNRAKGVIDEIISSQSLDVDVVSGATYSSRGIINAVKNALTGEEDTSKTPDPVEPQGSSTVDVVEDASAYKDGTYYGTGTGFGGSMTVKVVISDGKIASIDVVSNNDDAAYFNRAKALLATIVSTQSTNVDTVSGATYSSVGLINAVRNALAQAAVDSSAAEELEAAASSSVLPSSKPASVNSAGAIASAAPSVTGKFPYLNGIYTGTAEGWGGDVTVAVTIKDQTLTKIEVTGHEDETEEYFNNAMSVIASMINTQSTDVDVISGATYSSNGIIDATIAALESAKAATEAANNENRNPETDPNGGDSDVNPGNDDNKKPDGENNGDAEEPDDNDGENTEGTIYRNGTYTGVARCIDTEYGEFDYELGLTVTIENDQIVDISNITEDGIPYTNGTDNKTYLKRAAEGRSTYVGVLSQILALKMFDENTRINVDTGNLSADENTINAVTGATYSSESIYNAVLDALDQARITEDVDIEDSGNGENPGNIEVNENEKNAGDIEANENAENIGNVAEGENGDNAGNSEDNKNGNVGNIEANVIREESEESE